MKKEKEFIIIRYLMLIFIAMEILFKSSTVSAISIIFIAFFVVNNQLRLFYLSEKQSLFSIILEIGIASYISIFFCGTIVLYLLPVVIDWFVVLESRNSIILLILAFIFNTLISFKEGFSSILNNSAFLSLIVMIMLYLHKENERKLSAQFLYDKLRVTERELRIANRNLENYASSIEELAILKERNRISREIHDNVGHALSTTMIQLSAIERIANKEKSAIENIACNLREFVKDSLDDVRKAIKELKPDKYNEVEVIFKIEELLKNFEKMTDIKIIYRISKNRWLLNYKLSNVIYRIIQEALSNSLKHGKATEIRVIMNFSDEGLVLLIEDNGLGCDEVIYNGVGLKGIEERVREINGELEISTSKGSGFKIKLSINRNYECN
ncbi:sensor histidine kinase [Clostridium massiliamazoniense]|uniref:sensor histidine kinase n=1 Tax=Clostridium massiliamazoniense TaxID=1347366 RepID=UPI0006D81E9A|nr:sensor histidine kinase [Clostridium massiliamazoniense]